MKRRLTTSTHAARGGYALILAIVVLAALFAIATPFLLSARASARTSGVRAGDARARLEADAALAAMIRRLEETDPEVDPTPAYDAPSETSPELDFPDGFYKLRDPSDAIVSAHAVDEQGKVDVDSASPNAFGMLFCRAFLSTDLKEDGATVSVDSTEGFPGAGMLWVQGELIRYQSKTSSQFEGCTRGELGSDYGPYEKPPKVHRAGVAVIDARAHELAKYRVRGPGGGFRPYETISALARARGAWQGAEGFAAADIARAQSLLTLWAGRNGHDDWSAGSRVISAIVPDGRLRSIQIENARYFGPGTTVRIEGPEGVEYGLVVAANGNQVTLEEPLTLQASAYQAKASILIPHPVNVNSAPQPLLEAMLTGIHLANRVPLEPITRDQARQLAARMKAEPVRGWQDLCERILKTAMDETLLTPNQVIAVVVNGEHPNDQVLGYSTVPFAFTSGGVSTIVASTSMNAPSGIERGRVETESVVEVHRQNHGADDAGLHVVARQWDFDERFRLSRRARGWMTYPFNTTFWTDGADPPPRYPAMFSVLGKSGFDLQVFGSDDVERTYAQLAPSRSAFPDNRSEHFDTSVMPEGNDLGKFPWAMDVSGGIAQLGDSGTGYLYGGSVSGWFRFDPASGTLFDLGADSMLRDRITLAFEQGDLVLRMRDPAGDDPDPARLVRNEIRFPAGGQIQANIWYHFTIAFRGSSPSDYALFIDGLPRGERRLATSLTGSLPSYAPGDPPIPIPVESTAGFPDFGVLRIGNELVDYSSKTPNSFLTTWTTTGKYGWIGGRGAREFSINVLNANYAHSAGEAVVLYGYTARLTSWVLPGGGSIPSNIGRFGAAKIALNFQPTSAMTALVALPNGQNQPVPIGQGILGANAQGAHPLTDIELEPVDPSDASFMDSFHSTGGYVVVFQFTGVSGWTIVSQPPATLFGCELMRYSGKQGTKLVGIQRAVALPPHFPDGSQDGKGAQHAFVTKWTNPNLDKDYRAWIYVVPCSIPVGGVDLATNYFVPGQNDSAVIQLLDGPDGQSPDDGKTEWVEYDSISGDGHFLRLNATLWNYARSLVTTPPPSAPNPPGNPQQHPPPPPVSQAATEHVIGAPEVATEPWVTNQLRTGLQFRGTHSTWTQSHKAPTQAMAAFLVLRTIDIFGGRPGRLDRMCILEPQQTGVTYWRTVNWASVKDQNQYWVATREHLPKLGIPPGQLVSNPNNPPPPSIDSRDYARMLKTPSGELPRKTGVVRVGGTFDGSGDVLVGSVDEIEFNSQTNGGKAELLAKYVLSNSVSETAMSIPVENNLAVYPHGMLGFNGANFLSKLPTDAGVLLVGDELIAYDSVDPVGQTIAVAPNGRGFLGTKPKAHGRSETAVFFEHLVASQLSSGVDARGSALAIENADGFAPEGTVLIGSELAHYTRLRNNALEMPEFDDESGTGEPTPGAGANGTRAVVSTQRKGGGIFRGRYGTAAISHNAGDVVLRFPFRYADKWVVGSDAPEVHYLQLDDAADAALWKRVYWKEELPVAGVSIECLARLDARSSWTAEPGRADGLWLFTKPLTDGIPNPVIRRGERLELRFGVRYAADSFDVIVPGMTNATKRNDAWKTAPRLRQVATELIAATRTLRREEHR